MSHAIMQDSSFSNNTFAFSFQLLLLWCRKQLRSRGSLFLWSNLKIKIISESFLFPLIDICPTNSNFREVELSATKLIVPTVSETRM